MISKLLNAEDKVHEKAAAVTTDAANLESTNADKVSIISTIDSTKDSTIAATPKTTTTATTTTAATTTTRSL